MVEIFVNLKRFDVPKKLGGICPEADPSKWIESIIRKTIEFGLGKSDKAHLTFLLPESLLLSAMKEMRRYPQSETENLDIGPQSVFRENIAPGGKFWCTHIKSSGRSRSTYRLYLDNDRSFRREKR